MFGIWSRCAASRKLLFGIGDHWWESADLASVCEASSCGWGCVCPSLKRVSHANAWCLSTSVVLVMLGYVWLESAEFVVCGLLRACGAINSIKNTIISPIRELASSTSCKITLLCMWENRGSWIKRCSQVQQRQHPFIIHINWFWQFGDNTLKCNTHTGREDDKQMLKSSSMHPAQAAFFSHDVFSHQPWTVRYLHAGVSFIQSEHRGVYHGETTTQQPSHSQSEGM